jgi:hypothetical protein
MHPAAGAETAMRSWSSRRWAMATGNFHISSSGTAEKLCDGRETKSRNCDKLMQEGK